MRDRIHRSGLSRRQMPPIGEAKGSTSREERMASSAIEVHGLERLDDMPAGDVARACASTAVDLAQIGHSIWDVIPDDGGPEPEIEATMKVWVEWAIMLDAEQAKALVTTLAALQVLRVMLADER